MVSVMGNTNVFGADVQQAPTTGGEFEWTSRGAITSPQPHDRCHRYPQPASGLGRWKPQRW